jgi:hypothetical protein
MGKMRRGIGGLVLAAVLGVAGCGVPGYGSKSPVVTPNGTTTTSAPTPTKATSKPPVNRATIRNDLKTGALKRTFNVAGLTVSVDYGTSLKVDRWTPEAAKPLNVSVTAFTNGKRAQKIYLTRVRANIGVSDGSGPLDAPSPLVDEANIGPGFIVTFPYTYGQVFLLPAVDAGAQSLTLDFTYEFLLQVAPNSRDYAKQTARDSFTVALV